MYRSPCHEVALARSRSPSSSEEAQWRVYYTNNMALKAKSPGVKRILQEAKDLVDTPDYTAAPLEDNVFEWYASPCHTISLKVIGISHYVARLVQILKVVDFMEGVRSIALLDYLLSLVLLPVNYPFKPPTFRFCHENGRFEIEREICLSISAHHEESCTN